MVVIRQDKLGNLKNSKPCNHCLDNLKFFGIRTVFYSTDDGDIKKCKLEDIEYDHYSGRQSSYYKFLNGISSSPLQVSKFEKKCNEEG